MLNIVLDVPLAVNDNLYLIINYVDWSKFLAYRRHFFPSITTSVEPYFYFEVILDEHWRSVMRLEIDAIEKMELG